MKKPLVILTSIILLTGCSVSMDSEIPEPETTYTATLYNRDGNIVNTWSNLTTYYSYHDGQLYELYHRGLYEKKNRTTVTVGEGQMIVHPETNL